MVGRTLTFVQMYWVQTGTHAFMVCEAFDMCNDRYIRIRWEVQMDDSIMAQRER